MIVLSSLGVLVALGAIWVLFSRWLFDIVSIFCFSFLLFYGFRMVVVATGADGLYPDYLFTSDPSAVESVNLLLLGFLICTGIGLAVGRSTSMRTPWLFPAVERRPSADRYWYVALALTVVATIITGFLLVRYQGFAGMVRASKFDKELAGTFLLRMFPSMGSAVAAAGFLDLRQRAASGSWRTRWRSWALAGMAVLDGLWVYAWGSRSQLVVVAFMLLVGLAVFRVRSKAGRSGRRSLVVRLVVVGVCLGAIVFGLRVSRDLIIAGTVNETIAGESAIRQFSVASNSTSYDAFVLAVRDWPAEHEYREGEDFLVGTTGVVPRNLWADKPEQVIPGSWFRQVYEPEKRNGWPMGVAGEWYLNWGAIGVLVGGVLTGLVLAFAQRTLHRTRSNPWAFACTAVIGFMVLELGVGSQFVLRWVGFVVPLIVLTYVLRANAPPDTDRPASGGTPSSRVAQPR